jgi:GNAT superfamily N-acetyltransferase
MVGHFLVSTPYGKLLAFVPAVVVNLAGWVLEHGHIVVGERDGVLVGFIALVAAPHPISGEPVAEELAWWVEPSARRGRLSYYLLRSAEDWARQKGLSMLKMVAPSGSTVGAFYERLGYSPVETAYIKRLTA